MKILDIHGKTKIFKPFFEYNLLLTFFSMKDKLESRSTILKEQTLCSVFYHRMNSIFAFPVFVARVESVVSKLR